MRRSDRPQNEVVENILDIIVFLTVIVLMLVALPFYAAYAYTRLGIHKLKKWGRPHFFREN